MKERYIVRRAESLDAAGIVKCLHAAFAPFEHLYSAEGYRDTTLTQESVHERLRTMTVFVAEAGGQIVGTIGCGRVSAEEGHIRGMAVLPEWQGRGVAQKLLDTVVEELRARGCKHITLDTTEPLQRAMRFYERNGFERSGKVSDFFGMALHEYVRNLY